MLVNGSYLKYSGKRPSSIVKNNSNMRKKEKSHYLKTDINDNNVKPQSYGYNVQKWF